MARAYSVYRIRFVDGAEYFGITSQDLNVRIGQHIYGSCNRGVADRMDVSMDFEVSLMAEEIPKSEALELESGYIRSGKNVLNEQHSGKPRPKTPLTSKNGQVFISFNAPQQLHDAVEKRANALGVKKSLLFREAIVSGLDKAVKRIKAEKERLPE